MRFQFIFLIKSAMCFYWVQGGDRELMEPYTILIVDDEKEITKLIEIYLISDGYRVLKAHTGGQALKLLKDNTVHLAILDLVIPEIDGLELCRRIRKTMDIPIIMLSARNNDLDKIIGLTNGADDFVTKPFNPLELSTRVKSQMRRYTQLNPHSALNAAPLLQLRGLCINKETHSVTLDGEEIRLTPIEFNILYLLASQPGKVFSTDEIFKNVWNAEVYEANNTVMVHIRRLRHKLKEDTRTNKIISTVWGIGYKIEDSE